LIKDVPCELSFAFLIMELEGISTSLIDVQNVVAGVLWIPVGLAEGEIKKFVSLITDGGAR